MKIGFVILSHSDSGQLLRLVRTLQLLYDNPPIACHHDFSQATLDLRDFPSEVAFVIPSTRTKWGHISVITATLRAIDLLFHNTSPEWFFLISAADYPVARPERVISELKVNHADALLDFRRIELKAIEIEQALNESLSQFSASENVAMAWHRYVGAKIFYPIMRSGPQIGRGRINLPFAAPRSPFTNLYHCYYGDHWFAGNARTAKALLSPSGKDKELKRHLRSRVVPEECYYPSVLANTTGISIDRSTKRFAIWAPGSPHPKMLNFGDLPAIQTSQAYFARKFSPNSPVLDELDKSLRVHKPRYSSVNKPD